VPWESDSENEEKKHRSTKDDKVDEEVDMK
jgi:hypothetical protein